MSSAATVQGRRAAMPFILVVVFIDVLGIGIALPVLPILFGQYTASREIQAYRHVTLAKANPFSALLTLARHREIGNLVVVFALVVLAQLMLQTTWVLFTHFRFGWGTRENGFALFCVGLVAAVVQGGMLGTLLRRF